MTFQRLHRFQSTNCGTSSNHNLLTAVSPLPANRRAPPTIPAALNPASSKSTPNSSFTDSPKFARKRSVPRRNEREMLDHDNRPGGPSPPAGEPAARKTTLFRKPRLGDHRFTGRTERRTRELWPAARPRAGGAGVGIRGDERTGGITDEEKRMRSSGNRRLQG